jgi:hypothetical protein
MLIAVLVVIACTAALSVLAAAIFYRSSNRSPVWNMALGVILAFVALAVLAIVAAVVSWFSARAIFRPN